MPAQVETIAYNVERGVPWHGLGTPVQGLMTAEDAIAKGGLDWAIEQRPLVAEGKPVIHIPDKVAQVRTTDNAYLGVVGKGYQTIQNADGFVFANSLVAENPDKALYDTVGSLNGGRMVFLSMDLTAVAPINVAGDGDFKTFLLLANAHDGSKALHAAITPVRVVCMNTLNAALSGGTPTFRIRHSGSIEGKLAAAREALGMTIDYVKRFEQVAEAAQKVKVSDERAQNILRAVFKMSDKTAEKAEGTLFEKQAATRTFDLYQTSDDLAPFRGTGWGLVNAVAEYVDHERSYGARKKDAAADLRMYSILWGGAQQAIENTLGLVNHDLVAPGVVKRLARISVKRAAKAGVK